MTFGAMRIDVHQHIWTESLIAALARRECLPFVRRPDGLTVLHSADEHPYLIEVESELPERRAALVRSDGLDLALIAISSPIGIEALPRDEALELIEAHLGAVSALGEEFAQWGPLTLDRPEPGDVDRLLARGCVGVSLPAGAIGSYDALDAHGGLLERIARCGVPLLIHPGRSLGQPACGLSLGEPLWWRALTDYVAQMQAAWLSFVTLGRREHPELRVLFPMLAGGAPLLSERLSARGGPTIELRDPLTFYDCSSYGPSAVAAMAHRVGAAQLVYGSDRPVVEPADTGRDRALQENGARLLVPVEVGA
jgi:predicted TIM-barrel fold metal-dependent hydrolase